MTRLPFRSFGYSYLNIFGRQGKTDLSQNPIFYRKTARVAKSGFLPQNSGTRDAVKGAGVRCPCIQLIVGSVAVCVDIRFPQSVSWTPVQFWQGSQCDDLIIAGGDPHGVGRVPLSSVSLHPEADQRSSGGKPMALSAARAQFRRSTAPLAGETEPHCPVWALRLLRGRKKRRSRVMR